MSSNVASLDMPSGESEEQLPSRQHVTGFGFYLYLLSDGILFSALFAVFAVLRTATDGGPDGHMLFSSRNAFIETACLLTSSFACGIAMLACDRRNKFVALVGFLITAVLGIVFLTLEIHEFSDLIARGDGPDRSAFLSSFFYARQHAWLACDMRPPVAGRPPYPIPGTRIYASDGASLPLLQPFLARPGRGVDWRLYVRLFGRRLSMTTRQRHDPPAQGPAYPGPGDSRCPRKPARLHHRLRCGDIADHRCIRGSAEYEHGSLQHRGGAGCPGDCSNAGPSHLLSAYQHRSRAKDQHHGVRGHDADHRDCRHRIHVDHGAPQSKHGSHGTSHANATLIHKEGSGGT